MRKGVVKKRSTLVERGTVRRSNTVDERVSSGGGGR